MNRSPFFYVGDKYKIFNQIIAEFPKKINNYFEPFLGGGSSFINVSARKYVLNDIDSYLIKLHQTLFSYSSNPTAFFKKMWRVEKQYGLSASYRQNIIDDKIKFKYKKTYYSYFNKSAYLNLREDFNSDKTQLIKLYILMIYGFNRMLRFNKKGNFNIPVGNVDMNKNVINSLNFYFDFVSNHNISYYNKDYFDFLKNITFQKNDFIYFDPPYLVSNSEYNKLWSEVEEKKLLNFLDFLNDSGIKWAISNMIFHKGKENTIFSDWSKKYNQIIIQSNYISYHDNSIKNKSIEVLVKNYE